MGLPSFTADDVRNLEQFANAIQRKTAYGPIPDKLTVSGIDVPIRAVAPQVTPVVAPDEEKLRALYSLTGKDIQVFCAGIKIANTARAFDHIVCVVGHEALHAIQQAHFTKDQLEEASRLHREAGQSSENYAAYISCAVELPAHAVMIALELRKSNPSEFDIAARRTHIYEYFEKNLRDTLAKDDVLQRLVATAREMHQAIKP